MADKISTVILKVDLNCRSCYKKISKTICKLQAREKIQTVAFDEKNGTVTISGPFDPEKLCKKLCCKACKVIIDIQIIKPEPEPKPEPKPEPEPSKACKVIIDIQIKPEPEPEPEPEPKPKPEPKPNGSGPTCHCGCKLWYDGYYGACPWCGRGYGWTPVVVPQPVVVWGAPPACAGYKTCEFFYEEDPQSSCSIM